MAGKKNSTRGQSRAGTSKSKKSPMAQNVSPQGKQAAQAEEAVSVDIHADIAQPEGKQDAMPEKAVTMGQTAETDELAIDASIPQPAQLPVVEQTAPADTGVVPEGEVVAELKKEERLAVAKSRRPGPRLPQGIASRPRIEQQNAYMPQLATVVEIIEETPNIRTLRVVLDDNDAMANFHFEPGQVGQLSVFGAGEATFVINSTPAQKAFLQFSVMKTGEVTSAIHKLRIQDKIGLRAPLGNFFPYADWKGKNVFFVGGGIGMAPIRTIMLTLLENPSEYGKISLLYGARSPKDMAYSYELDDWKSNPDLDCTLCIDNPADNWGHKVGLIPKVLEELNPSPDNTVAVLCGPPIMIRFTLQALEKLGFAPANIVTTLEKRMKCGIGICGRCNIGDRYVCVDGPVFTLEELNGLPADL